VLIQTLHRNGKGTALVLMGICRAKSLSMKTATACVTSMESNLANVPSQAVWGPVPLVEGGWAGNWRESFFHQGSKQRWRDGSAIHPSLFVRLLARRSALAFWTGAGQGETGALA